MSGRRTYEPGCYGKRRYRSEAEASDVIASARRNAKRGQSQPRVPQRAYYCDGCRGYHLTSQPPRSSGSR